MGHNGFVASTKGQQNAVAQPTPPFRPRKRNSVVKNEKAKSSQPPTPLSNSKSHTPLKSEDDDHELDAEAEEEDETTEQARSPSPMLRSFSIFSIVLRSCLTLS